MSNLITFAEDELRKAGLLDKDSDYDGELGRFILQVVGVFSRAGHSGESHGQALAILNQLLCFKPLSPLTGEDDEWTHVSDVDGEELYQNKRYPSVFKQASLGAWNVEGRLFETEDGTYVINSNSRVYITFPYTPKTEYVKYEPSNL